MIQIDRSEETGSRRIACTRRGGPFFSLPQATANSSHCTLCAARLKALSITSSDGHALTCGLPPFSSCAAPITRFALSADGQLAAAGAEDGSLGIWCAKLRRRGSTRAVFLVTSLGKTRLNSVRLS